MGYPKLWRYLARGRLKQDGAGELGKKRSSLEPDPHAVVSFGRLRSILGMFRTSRSSEARAAGAAWY
jgi:hypothetical protein